MKMSRSKVHTFRGWADEEGIHFAVSAFQSVCRELEQFTILIGSPEQIKTHKQQALYWVWVKESSSQTGYTQTETDTRFREEYAHDKLMKVVLVDGCSVRERLSLNTLSRKEMADLLDNIYYGEYEKGIILSQDKRDK